MNKWVCGLQARPVWLHFRHEAYMLLQRDVLSSALQEFDKDDDKNEILASKSKDKSKDDRRDKDRDRRRRSRDPEDQTRTSRSISPLK